MDLHYKFCPWCDSVYLTHVNYRNLGNDLCWSCFWKAFHLVDELHKDCLKKNE